MKGTTPRHSRAVSIAWGWRWEVLFGFVARGLFELGARALGGTGGGVLVAGTIGVAPWSIRSASRSVSMHRSQALGSTRTVSYATVAGKVAPSPATWSNQGSQGRPQAARRGSLDSPGPLRPDHGDGRRPAAAWMPHLWAHAHVRARRATHGRAGRLKGAAVMSAARSAEIEQCEAHYPSRDCDRSLDDDLGGLDRDCTEGHRVGQSDRRAVTSMATLASGLHAGHAHDLTRRMCAISFPVRVEAVLRTNDEHAGGHEGLRHEGHAGGLDLLCTGAQG